MSPDKQAKESKSQKVNQGKESLGGKEIPGTYGDTAHSDLLQRALENPHLVTPAVILQLQRTYGNRATTQAITKITDGTGLPIQRSPITISEAIQMSTKGYAIRIDDSGLEEGKIRKQGAGYALVPNLAWWQDGSGLKPTTQSLRSKLAATLNYARQEWKPPQGAKVHVLKGALGGQAESYGGGITLKKITNVQGATIIYSFSVWDPLDKLVEDILVIISDEMGKVFK